jgi:hypothetical protein
MSDEKRKSYSYNSKTGTYDVKDLSPKEVEVSKAKERENENFAKKHYGSEKNMQDASDATKALIDARMQGVKPYKKGGKVKSASARADGCAIRGKTRA